jgi:hypothetical protein
MARRLTKIDELTLPDHYRLEPTDDCYFIGEYTARGGYEQSDTNDLILNLKKVWKKSIAPMSGSGKPGRSKPAPSSCARFCRLIC